MNNTVCAAALIRSRVNPPNSSGSAELGHVSPLAFALPWSPPLTWDIQFSLTVVKILWSLSFFVCLFVSTSNLGGVLLWTSVSAAPSLRWFVSLLPSLCRWRGTFIDINLFLSVLPWNLTITTNCQTYPSLKSRFNLKQVFEGIWKNKKKYYCIAFCFLWQITSVTCSCCFDGSIKLQSIICLFCKPHVEQKHRHSVIVSYPYFQSSKCMIGRWVGHLPKEKV